MRLSDESLRQPEFVEHSSWNFKIEQQGWAVQVYPKPTQDEWDLYAARSVEAWSYDLDSWSIDRTLALWHELFPHLKTCLWRKADWDHYLTRMARLGG
jgi:hypothetical protein